jgi:hypothetical protein
MRLEIEVDISGGGTVRGICTAPPGSWGLSVDADLHRAKITDCLRVRFDESRISQLLAMVDALDTLSSDQVGELATLLA